MDADLDNYTDAELLSILGLPADGADAATSDEIIGATADMIQRFENEDRPDMVEFFTQTQARLLDSLDAAERRALAEQTDRWMTYEVLPQSDAVQRDKVTDRVQKIDVYNDNHFAMKREQLGVTNVVDTKVAQDTLNPTLKNTLRRFINLDSQFRQPAGGVEASATDYVMDLSDPLTNVLRLQLYSIQIPYTWYVIDYAYGNTCFWVANAGETFLVSLEPGNYSPEEFCAALHAAFKRAGVGQGGGAGFTYPGAPPEPRLARYNANNGKITLYLDGWTDPAGQPVAATLDGQAEPAAYFLFFDATGQRTCYESDGVPCGNGVRGQTFSGTLGWLMGFRALVQPVLPASVALDAATGEYAYSGGNTPVSVINLYGPKYFIVVLDDFNQNHLNNGLVSITELSKVLAVPSYYNGTQPHVCVAPPRATSVGAAAGGSVKVADDSTRAPDAANVVLDKMVVQTSSVPVVLPSAPRTLTAAQLYTVNEILKTRANTTSFRAKAPTTTDTFALIPLKGGLRTGEVYVDFSGGLQDNVRLYFGPVNIDRLHLKLLDDRGNVVDLHGADWNITLFSENLYQY